jgi:hypothetical protein
MKNAQLKGFNMNYQRKKCNSPKYKVQGGAPVHVFFFGMGLCPLTRSDFYLISSLAKLVSN